MTRLYWPVAHELRRGKGGEKPVMPGPDTEASCEHALRVAKESGRYDYVIVATAGVSPAAKWGGIAMSHVMSEYMIDGGGDPAKIISRPARRFDTIGEAKELVKFLEENPSVQEVVICCKWWHLLRCWIILDAYLTLSKKIDWPVRMVPGPCESLASDQLIQREFWGAIPLNMLKILIDQPFVFLRLWMELLRKVREKRHVRQITRQQE